MSEVREFESLRMDGTPVRIRYQDKGEGIPYYPVKGGEADPSPAMTLWVDVIDLSALTLLEEARIYAGKRLEDFGGDEKAWRENMGKYKEAVASARQRGRHFECYSQVPFEKNENLSGVANRRVAAIHDLLEKDALVDVTHASMQNLKL